MRATGSVTYGLVLAVVVMCALGPAGAFATAAVAGGEASAQEPRTGAPEETEFNPQKAEKNLEVGKYYLKKGNLDAAIDRLKDAIRYKSNFAEPHRLLGEAYEKKGNLKEAVAYYEKYLKILPGAEDAEKVRKRIDKLSQKMEPGRSNENKESEAVDGGDVEYPLKGFIGYTNVGTPVRGMTVECFVDGWSKRVAKTDTDASGRFSFPDLAEGTYYIRASKEGLFEIKTIVNATKKSTSTLYLITEAI